ncbi:MAG TPA: VOC family protein [Cyclobacteriaceae bacterium]|jgi:predicted enzyme related to lactoylglutathione lyase
MQNAINWFEIPVNNLERAQKFYETIMDISMIPVEVDTFRMLMFPVDDSRGVGGALIESPGNYNPSLTDGPLIYLNGNPDLQNVLNRVEGAGGKIMVPKTQITPEYGYMAVIQDTEGNRIALHSNG